jgi:hypothetical protein
MASFTGAVTSGYFTAVFTGEPAKNWVVPGSVKLNRAGGRQVSWTAAPEAFAGTEGIFGYWTSMAEMVGYYGSTFGEPPFGTGRRTATLNGRPCPASM